MQPVARIADIPAGRGVKVKHGDDEVLLVRDGDAVRAYQATCPHAGAPLDEGAVCNGHIVCPWHKAVFKVADGALVEPPALHGLARYAVSVDGDQVLLGEKLADGGRTVAVASGKVALIVGAGAAGAAAAAALREFGFDGRVELLGREDAAPYDRTALSKFVLDGGMAPDEVPKLLADDFFASHRIERVTGAVRELDVTARRAVLADGREILFDTALICTGGAPVRLDIPGAEKQGVHVLRTLHDAAALAGEVRPGARVVILGSSFIGLEAASGLRARGLDVSVASPEAVPFARQFGQEIGGAIKALHEEHGVRFHAGRRAARIEGDARCAAVVLDNGLRLDADIVLMAVGVKPVADFVSGVAVAEDGGLTADAGMRIAERVFVAGDAASFPLPHGGRARIEHWRVAQQQARVAARNMAGQDAVYDGVPFFWTYHYGTNYEYIGHAEHWDEVVVLGDVRRQDFVALLCAGDVVRAAVACGRERDSGFLIEAMRRELTVDEARTLLEPVRGETTR